MLEALTGDETAEAALDRHSGRAQRDPESVTGDPRRDAAPPIPGSACDEAAARPGMMVMDSSPLSIGIARRAMLVE
jgi:hypothetical protein